MRKLWGVAMLSTLLLGSDEAARSLEKSLICRYTEADIAALEERIKTLEATQRALIGRLKQLETLLLAHDKVLKTLWLEREDARKQAAEKAALPAKKSSAPFRPGVYETARPTPIHAAPDGRIIGELPARYRFTANRKKEGWLHISGHFPRKKWEDFDKEAWIAADGVKRVR